MESKIEIYCMLTKTLWLGLANVRENYGHDDTLPYQADVFILDADAQPKFKKIGSIWNDGWGGDSVFEISDKENTEAYRKLADDLCKKHQMYYRGKPVCEYSLLDTCDSMACGFLAVQSDPDASAQANGRTLIYKFDDDPAVLSNPTMMPVFISKKDFEY